MAALTQLRLPGETEFSWYALARRADRPLYCSTCARRIAPGSAHARGEDGRRICVVCIASSERGETMSATDANRRARQRKSEHAQRRTERAIRMLLDGLEVGSIHELKALVDAARKHETHESRYMVDRAGAYSSAVGLARLALNEGQPERAAKYLDDAVEETHRDHWDACIADGHSPESVERFLGPRDRSER